MDAATTQKIEWTLGSGKKASVTINLKLNKKVNSDGWKVDVGCCEKEIIADVESIGFMGSHIETVKKEVNGTFIRAKIGNLGLTQPIYDKIKAAELEVEKHPAWVAKKEKEEKNRNEMSEYYKTQSGICHKCGSYCYGDCEAN